MSPMRIIMFNIEDISLRAKGLKPGVVTPEEVAFARSILQSRDGDIPGAIIIVGLCGISEDAPLLERYLFGEENNIYVEYSLKALCRYLQLTDRYRSLLREWMQMKNDDGWRRMPAIHLADEYFHGFEDPELGRYFIDCLCDLQDDDRLSIRNVLVDILGMRSQLKDPFGLQLNDWDEETTVVVTAAAKKFGYHGWAPPHAQDS